MQARPVKTSRTAGRYLFIAQNLAVALATNGGYAGGLYEGFCLMKDSLRYFTPTPLRFPTLYEPLQLSMLGGRQGPGPAEVERQHEQRRGHPLSEVWPLLAVSSATVRIADARFREQIDTNGQLRS